MTTNDKPGNHIGPKDYPDHRSKEQLEADREQVRRQLKVLSAPEARRRLDQIIRQIQARQDKAPRKYALPFDRYPVVDAAGAVAYLLVSRGQLIVRMDSPGMRGPSGRLVLRRLGYRPSKRAHVPRDKRYRVYEGCKAPDVLARDVADLGRRRIVAGMNQIVPLGHIIKGDDYPAITTGPPALEVLRSPSPPVDVRVAVIDTGITPEDRTDNWLDTVLRQADNTDPLDVLPNNGSGVGDGRLDWWGGHGSFAAGIVQRVAPGCEIVAYKFTVSDGLGTDVDAAAAMLRAAEEANADGVRLIINASLGTPGINRAAPTALQATVQQIHARFPNVLIVASAGNNGTTEEMYPAALPGVIAVGALTNAMRPADFSSRGPWVHCSTIGVGVVSTFVAGTLPPEPDPNVPDYSFAANSWAVWTGTSFSAPQISGAVAQACLDNPGLQPRDALDGLLAGAPVEPDFGKVLRLLPGTPS